MARALYTNNAAGTLASSLSSGATSLTLNSGQGSLFPSPTNGDYAYITLSDAATGLNIEIVQCTARVGDVLTIVRGQQGTSPLSFIANDDVQLRVTSGGMDEVTSSAAHGYQLFTGSGTFTCPSGVTAVKLTIVSGGGGGGGIPAAGSYAGGGGGGSGAGMVFSVSVTPFSTYSVVVGSGGAGGVGASGASGGTSSFTASVTYSVSGGTGGGVGGSAAGGGGTGGRTFSNIDLKFPGGDGVAGVGASPGYGGAGGSSWVLSTLGGDGASAPYGGEGYSGGGGAGWSTVVGTAFSGGAGSDGFVLVEW